MNGFTKKTISFLMITFILTGFFAGYSAKAASNIPKINFVGIDHSPLIEGDKESFLFTSIGCDKVQYRAFLYTKAKNEWKEIMNWTNAVDSNIPYKFSYPTPFEAGKYKLSVWVKRAGEKGINSNKNGDYDSYYVAELNCVKETEAERVRADGDMVPEKDTYKVGEKIVVNGVDNLRGRKGPYKFRLHIFDVNEGKWIMDEDTYRDNPEWTPDKPGTYVLDLWGISSNTVHLSKLQADPFARFFDIWKLKTITVKDDDNTGEHTTPKGDDNTGKYITPKSDTALLLSPPDSYDTRHLISGKNYKILGQSGNYYKVKVGKAYGYIDKANTTLIDGEVNDKMTLAWQQLGSGSYTNDNYLSYVSKKTTELGLDAISPTWFYFQGNAANPSSIKVGESGNYKYMSEAHKNGYEIWPRLLETWGKNDRLDVIFNNADVRKKVIDDTIACAKKYDVDGINLDIEGIGNSRKDGYTSFVKELYSRLKAEGLGLSIDVGVPAPWNEYYNFSVIKDYADYIYLMAYDEHHAGSTEPGSVGSYTFVEKAIKDTLALNVPPSKIMLGVPFYLRDYTVIGASDLPYDSVVLSSSTAVYESASQSSNQRSNEAAGKTYPYKGEEGDFYKVDYDGFGSSGYVLKSASRHIPAGIGSASVIGSSALSMQEGIDTINDYKGTIKYDETAKQYYVKYIKDDKSHMVWLEDDGSIKWRMDFVNKYNLGGMGAWSLGRETPDTWEIIKTKLK